MPELLVNSDFTERVVLATQDLPWIASPQQGVERRMLDRVGGEVARATSLVRYAPASDFPVHEHALGEEFLVLDGVFSDEHGDYPAGTYVRNPPGSSHLPRTRPGCTIFVKLRQMRPAENRRVVIDTRASSWQAVERGRQRLPLFDAVEEFVVLETLDAGAQLPDEEQADGEEIFVLSGDLADGEGNYDPATWIRNPAGYRRALRSRYGAVYWVKRGHLRPAT